MRPSDSPLQQLTRHQTSVSRRRLDDFSKHAELGIEDHKCRRQMVEQVRGYLVDFGEVLAALPDETWASSISQWNGLDWELFIDLWTVQSGRCDLVLCLRVAEAEGGYRFEVESLYVP